METITASSQDKNVSPEVERFKDHLTRSLPKEFVEYVLYPKSHRSGYHTSQSIVSEQFSFLVKEHWEEGAREVVSYEDGSVTLRIRETNPNINVTIVLTREEQLLISGLLPIPDTMLILHHARESGRYSARNLVSPDSVFKEIDVFKYLFPEKAIAIKGVECSFEVDSEGKFLIKGLYLTD